MIKKIKFEHILLILSSALLLFALVPIFYVGLFDRITSWDDVAYSLEVRNLIQSGGGFSEIIAAIWDKFVVYYNTWQGTYSSIVMFSLQPAIWGHKYYAFTPFIMAAVLYLSTLFLSKNLIQIFLKQKSTLYLSLANLIMLIFLMFMPSINNGIYWYNGAMHYTFFYSMHMIFITLNLKILTKDIKWFWFAFLLFIIFAFILSGSNLVTMLLNACLTFGVFLISLIIKRSHKVVGLAFLCSAAALIGLYLDVKAPGHTVRQVYENPMPAGEALTASISQIWSYFKNYTYISLVSAVAVFVAAFWNKAKQAEFKFKHPWFLFLFSLCVLGASSMPAFYATSYEGPERLQNIVYFSYVLLFFINFIYFSGWLSQRKFISKISFPKIANIAIVSVLIISFFGALFINFNGSNVEMVVADTKVARQYGEEWDEVWEILNSSYNGHVRVAYPEYFPFTLTQFYDFGKSSEKSSYFDIVFARFTNKMSFAFEGQERVMLSQFRNHAIVGTQTTPINFMIKTSDLDGRVHYINLRSLATLLKNTNAQFDVELTAPFTFRVKRNFPVGADYIDEIPYTGKTYLPYDNEVKIIIDGEVKKISAFYWEDKCYVALRDFVVAFGGIEVKANTKKGVELIVEP